MDLPDLLKQQAFFCKRTSMAWPCVCVCVQRRCAAKCGCQCSAFTSAGRTKAQNFQEFSAADLRV